MMHFSERLSRQNMTLGLRMNVATERLGMRCLITTCLLVMTIGNFGCSTRPISTRQLPAEHEHLNSLLSYEKILVSLQQVCPPNADSPWTDLLNRIKLRLASAEQHAHHLKNTSIHILDCRKALSFVAPPDTVLISTGMLSVLPSESALAFLVAHELAHIALNHVSIGDAAHLEFQRGQERAADMFALHLLMAAHYNPKAALAVFSDKKLFASIEWHLSPTHPEVQERKEILEETLLKSGVAPSGTISSRDFLRLKSLRKYY